MIEILMQTFKCSHYYFKMCCEIPNVRQTWNDYAETHYEEARNEELWKNYLSILVFLAVLGSWTSVQIWITVPLYIKLLLMAVLGSWTSVQIWITVLLYIKILFNAMNNGSSGIMDQWGS